METRSAVEGTATQDRTTIERKSDRELVVTRTIDGPPEAVFEAWTDAELFRQWWVPKSFPITLLSCEIDARAGGGYRLTFANGDGDPIAFFGRYLEVTRPSRLVWTNEEEHGGNIVTSATFEDDQGRTRVVIVDEYPSKDALDEAIAAEAISWNPETFDQLDDLLAKRGEGTRP
jgi:uncharacterized protein YndB with AHSA1/START domain